MSPSRVSPLLAAAVLAAGAALLAAGPAASARAPSAADQGSADWLLLRMAKDREEENKGGGVVDPVVAFRQGDTPLEGEGGWKAMLAVIYSPTAKPGPKADAATAVVERFKLEDERRLKLEDDKRLTEQKALWEIKRQVCRETLNQKGMLNSNTLVLGCVLKIQKALLAPDPVTWRETDSLKVRKKAYDDLVKKLK